MASAAVSAALRNCTLATNTLAGGAGGGASGTGGANGAAGQASGWDIYGGAGALRLANSILSGGTTLTPNAAPNAAGLTDAGYNISLGRQPGRRHHHHPLLPGPRLGVRPFHQRRPRNWTRRWPPNDHHWPPAPPGFPSFPNVTNYFTAFAMLTLAITNGSPAQGVIAGVPGVTFPAFDAAQTPRPTPASAGAYEGSPHPLKIHSNKAPIITTQPTNQTSLLGLAAAFSVTATTNGGDANTLGYQWQLDGTNIVDNAVFAGATHNTLTVKTVNPADDGYYRVIVSPSLLTARSPVRWSFSLSPFRPPSKISPPPS